MTISLGRFLFSPLKSQKGSALLIAAPLLGVTLAMAMLCIDAGYIFVSQSELQNAADAAALAALTRLPVTATEARNEAYRFGGENSIAGVNIILPDDVIETGRWSPETRTFTPSQVSVSAVRVRAARDIHNPSGELGLLIASLLRIRQEIAISKIAVAAADPRVVGVRGGHHLIPYALQKGVADQDGDGNYDIGRTVDINPRSDAPGNFGFLDFGADANAVPDLRREIEQGYGEDFVIPEAGFKNVPGSTGVEGNAVFDAFSAIIGDVVLMPVFESVSGTGDNASFRVVSLVALKIEAVDLTGNLEKRFIRAEIVQYVSSAFFLREGAPENNSLQKIRLVQ